MYKTIDVLNYDDFSLDKYITNLYNSMDKKIFKALIFLLVILMEYIMQLNLLNNIKKKLNIFFH